MNRRELVNAIAAHTAVDSKTVDAVLKGFTDVTTAVVSKGEPVAITGFAKFVKRESPARMGRNPATGEAIRIKASKKARITPLKGFKDAVLTPSLAPKLASGIWPPGGQEGGRRPRRPRRPARQGRLRRPRPLAKLKAPAKKAPARNIKDPTDYRACAPTRSIEPPVGADPVAASRLVRMGPPREPMTLGDRAVRGNRKSPDGPEGSAFDGCH